VLGDAGFLDRRLRILPALGFEAAHTSDGLARSAAFLGFEPVSLRDESRWLPGIGAIAELAPGLRAKANWKRAFRRPSFGELFHPDRGYIRGNPDLRSERATNADVGLEYAAERIGAARDLFVQVAAFRRDIDESIEWMFSRANTYMPVNTGSARVDGVELSASLDLLERVELEVGHTWTDARLTDTPTCLAALCNPVRPVFPHVPRRAGFVRGQLSLGDLRIYTELRYESEVGFQVGQRETADAAFQVDAGLSFHPRALPGLGSLPPSLSLSLDAMNLGREQRIDSLGQPLPRETLVFVRVRAVTP
jgi:outer membrane receptor protein involved in Fe transport